MKNGEERRVKERVFKTKVLESFIFIRFLNSHFRGRIRNLCAKEDEKTAHEFCQLQGFENYFRRKKMKI